MEEVAIAAITLTGAVAAGFFKLVHDQNKTHARLAKAIDKMADPKTNGNERIAKATELAAMQSEKRNGHLGELIVDSKNQILTSIQHVDKQEVENQTIKNKE